MARSTVDWREMVWRNLREDSAVANAYEAKPANLEAAWYCWVTHRGWSHLYSLSLSAYISTRQLKQHREGGPLKTWCAKQNRRTPARVIFKSLIWWTTDNDSKWGVCKLLKGSSNREGPAKEALWWPGARSYERTLIGPLLLQVSQWFPCMLGTARVPIIQAAVLPPCSTLTGQSCQKLEESFIVTFLLWQ